MWDCVHGHSLLFCGDLLHLCVCVCMWVHCAFAEEWVSLCWTWRVIAAFVDCWRQVVSHLSTAGKREGWRGFGDRGVLSGGGRDGCTPPSNHTWMNSRHRGNGRDWRMGWGQRGEWEIEIKEVLSYFESCVCVDICAYAATYMLVWQPRNNEIARNKGRDIKERDSKRELQS